MGIYNNTNFSEEIPIIIRYLKRCNLKSYMLNIVVDQNSKTYSYKTRPCVSESLSLFESIYLSNTLECQGLDVGIKYETALKEMLFSLDRVEYYTALDYIYNHLLLKKNGQIELPLDKDLYNALKLSAKNNEKFLKSVAFGKGENYNNKLYGFVQDIIKLFESAIV